MIEDERIFIPAEERGHSMSSFSVSVRLGHLLEDADVTLAADLHGCSYVELGAYRNCGSKTLDELRELVRTIQGGAGNAVFAEIPMKSTNPHLLTVAPEVMGQKVSELPLSVPTE